MTKKKKKRIPYIEFLLVVSTLMPVDRAALQHPVEDVASEGPITRLHCYKDRFEKYGGQRCHARILSCLHDACIGMEFPILKQTRSIFVSIQNRSFIGLVCCRHIVHGSPPKSRLCRTCMTFEKFARVSSELARNSSVEHRRYERGKQMKKQVLKSLSWRNGFQLRKGTRIIGSARRTVSRRAWRRLEQAALIEDLREMSSWMKPDPTTLHAGNNNKYLFKTERLVCPPLQKNNWHRHHV